MREGFVFQMSWKNTQNKINKKGFKNVNDLYILCKKMLLFKYIFLKTKLHL